MKTQVVIAGAGPTGLLLATELALHDFGHDRPNVIESREEPGVVHRGSGDGCQRRTGPSAGSGQVRGAANNDAPVTSSAAVERHQDQLTLRHRRRTNPVLVQRGGA